MVTEKKYLRYDFKTNEQADNAQILAKSLAKIGKLNLELVAVKSQFKSQIDAEKAVADQMTLNLNQGYEYRDVVCEVRFNEPVDGKKSIFRTDSGELVEVRKMSDEELEDLFISAGRPTYAEHIAGHRARQNELTEAPKNSGELIMTIINPNYPEVEKYANDEPVEIQPVPNEEEDLLADFGNDIE
jgi:hypothetical protein